MTINGRIAAVRAALQLKQGSFAEATGVSRSFLSQVEGGKFQPSITLLVGIANNFPQINMHWLLTGQGSMFTGPADQVKPPEPRTGLEAELEELRVLGRAAPQALAWRVLQELEGHAKGLTLQALQQTLQASAEALEATVINLRLERRIVLEGGLYKLQVPPLVKAISPGDQGAVVNVSMSTLLESVLPGLEHGQAGLLVSELQVDDVPAWLQRLRASVLELIAEQDREHGQRVRVVLASSAVDASKG